MSLLAGTTTEVRPLITAQAVTIVNLGTTDVNVYSDANDETNPLPIPAGWERTITLDGSLFRHDQAAFYLRSSDAATVALIWV